MHTEIISPCTVRLAIHSLNVRDSIQSILSELGGFALQEAPQATNVDVLVLEIGNDPRTELETMHALLAEGAVGTLFITSANVTPEILLSALRTGAKEFFQQPIIEREVREAFAKIRQQTSQSTPLRSTLPPGKIYSVLGAKGGVGTTTFAVNLATTLQSMDSDKSVALIDLNRLVGEVPIFLDLTSEINWEEIGKNINRLDAAYLKSALVRHSSGVYVMPAPVWVETASTLPPDFLLQILRIMRESFSFIVIDMGMVVDQESFRILERSETIFLIATLSLPCMINVKRIKDSLQNAGRIDANKIQVVANRYEKKSQINLAEAARITGAEINATLPNDYGLTMTAINNGKTLAEMNKTAAVTKAYHELAATLTEPVATKKRRWRLFG